MTGSPSALESFSASLHYIFSTLCYRVIGLVRATYIMYALQSQASPLVISMLLISLYNRYAMSVPLVDTKREIFALLFTSALSLAPFRPVKTSLYSVPGSTRSRYTYEIVFIGRDVIGNVQALTADTGNCANFVVSGGGPAGIRVATLNEGEALGTGTTVNKVKVWSIWL